MEDVDITHYLQARPELGASAERRILRFHSSFVTTLEHLSFVEVRAHGPPTVRIVRGLLASQIEAVVKARLARHRPYFELAAFATAICSLRGYQQDAGIAENYLRSTIMSTTYPDIRSG